MCDLSSVSRNRDTKEICIIRQNKSFHCLDRTYIYHTHTHTHTHSHTHTHTHTHMDTHTHTLTHSHTLLGPLLSQVLVLQGGPVVPVPLVGVSPSQHESGLHRGLVE